MDDFNERINILKIGCYILYGGELGNRLKNYVHDDLLIIKDSHYDEAEKNINKILKEKQINDKNLLTEIMKEVSDYSSTSEITGFCTGLKAGIKLFIELAIK